MDAGGRAPKVGALGDAGAVAEKYAWIKQHKTEFPVGSMCRFMRVSRSAYYTWLHRTPTQGEKDDAELTAIIQTLFAKSRATSGARHLKIALGRQDRTVSRRRMGWLMRETGLACKTKRKFKATTNSKHNHSIAPNHLDRQFTVERPNQAYIGDITYIHTQEGWLYLAVVIDLFSRQVVGWSMADPMRAQLVNDALLMAYGNASPIKVYAGTRIEEMV